MTRVSRLRPSALLESRGAPVSVHFPAPAAGVATAPSLINAWPPS